jgi:hypothetical protein
MRQYSSLQINYNSIFICSSMSVPKQRVFDMKYLPLHDVGLAQVSTDTTNFGNRNMYYEFFLIVVFPCVLIITQLLFQQNALVFIKNTRYYNLYF